MTNSFDCDKFAIWVFNVPINKPIKIISEDEFEVKLEDTELEITKKLNDFEKQKLVNELFGTTEVGQIVIRARVKNE